MIPPCCVTGEIIIITIILVYWTRVRVLILWLHANKNNDYTFQTFSLVYGRVNNHYWSLWLLSCAFFLDIGIWSRFHIIYHTSMRLFYHSLISRNKKKNNCIFEKKDSVKPFIKNKNYTGLSIIIYIVIGGYV